MLDESRVGLAKVTRGCPPASAYESQDLLRSLIREAAASGGLGSANRDVPFVDIIRPGATVLIKPNWVLGVNHSGGGMDCMVTHPAFILAALVEVLAARPGRVVIADAPIQGADFVSLVTPGWRAQVQAVAGETPVEILDLRNTIATRVGAVLATRGGRRPPDRFVLFDLGDESLLEPVSRLPGRFRITSYDPDEMSRVQGLGVHKFLLCKEAFEADVILNLPKLKAHAKAGITAALKNLVGLNGDKSYLPHHRLGGAGLGGDCYEGRKPFKRLAEWFLDQANRRIGRPSYRHFHSAARLANAVHGGDLEGKWAGNDTTWRMALDLNRILLYGDAQGVMHDELQRRVFSLTDGIVGGEGNGPLAPMPIALGAVTFAANSVFADLAHAGLMHFDWTKAALVRCAFAQMRYPLTSKEPREANIWCGGVRLSLQEAAAIHGLGFRPPDGWPELPQA